MKLSQLDDLGGSNTNSELVPLAVAAPAAAGVLAYLNAKTSFWYDWALFKATFKGLGRVAMRARRGQLSLFYDLEEKGQEPDICQQGLAHL